MSGLSSRTALPTRLRPGRPRSGAVIKPFAYGRLGVRPIPQRTYIFLRSTARSTITGTGFLRAERQEHQRHLHQCPDQGPVSWTRHTIANGDVIVIGHYSINAQLEAGPGAAAAPAQASSGPAWGGWQPQQAAAGVGRRQLGIEARRRRSAISGHGAMSQNWAPPPVNEPAVHVVGLGDRRPRDRPPPGWSKARSPRPAAACQRHRRCRGQLAESNVVDWARGGFGAASAPGSTRSAWPWPARLPGCGPDPFRSSTRHRKPRRPVRHDPATSTPNAGLTPLASLLTPVTRPPSWGPASAAPTPPQAAPAPGWDAASARRRRFAAAGAGPSQP